MFPTVSAAQREAATSYEAEVMGSGGSDPHVPLVRRGDGDLVVDLYAVWPDDEPASTLRAMWLRGEDGELLGWQDFEAPWTARASLRLPAEAREVEAFAHCEVHGTWSSGVIRLGQEAP